MSVLLHHGDCREVLKTLPDASVDACVTDPPYELGFMGKTWDAGGVAFDPATWREVLRVLKPGGHLLAFGGTRTYHRLACAIEDAGFEIRDSIDWVYGTGFPKSLDVSKAIDKAAGAVREVLAPGVQRAIGGKEGTSTNHGNGGIQYNPVTITAPATLAAKQWAGWGTALKPSHETIVVARKPLIGNVAENVLAHGTGAINVDGCRVAPSGERLRAPQSDPTLRRGTVGTDLGISGASIDDFQRAQRESIERTNTLGRWPPNTIFSHAPGCVRDGLAWRCVPSCPVAALDAQGGHSTTGKRSAESRAASVVGTNWGTNNHESREYPGDSGGASRFFPTFEAETPFLYCAKASRSEREVGCEALPAHTTETTVNRDPDSAGAQSPRAGAGRGAGAPIYGCSVCGLNLQGHRVATPCPKSADGQHVKEVRGHGAAARNIHPTVKPIALMRWLVRLVTPPEGVVLDPFMGAGSTGVAAVEEGFDFIGMELLETEEAPYLSIAAARINHAAADMQQAAGAAAPVDVPVMTQPPTPPEAMVVEAAPPPPDPLAILRETRWDPL